ncbi:cytochrome P450 family protein [Nocardia puris]|uniref:hypothetical protein n=1 Tax=Nocardia puris TaxID=208602 RepID=UPI002E20E28E
MENTAVAAVNSFCGSGQADLVEDYAGPVVRAEMDRVIGVAPDLGAEIAAAMAAASRAVDASVAGAEAERVNAALGAAITARRHAPGADVISALAGHPDAYTGAEILAVVALLYARAGAIADLIALVLWKTAIDAEFALLTVTEAIDDVLATDPPIANILTWPSPPQLMGGTWLPENEPVVVSLAAAGTDPAITPADPEDRRGSRSHLGWGIGPRACPAQDLARLIATVALDQILDALPDIRLARAPQWRASWQQRTLTHLPVTFSSAAPIAPLR